MTPLTPAGQAPDIRAVRMHRDIWDPAGVTGGLALRSWNGQAISVEWGEPDAEGFYEPTFRVSGTTEAERSRQAADRALAELRREDDLGAAWAEAEAALTARADWWRIRSLVETAFAPMRWEVVATDGNRIVRAEGHDPAAAIRALRAALIDKASKPEEGL